MCNICIVLFRSIDANLGGPITIAYSQTVKKADPKTKNINVKDAAQLNTINVFPSHSCQQVLLVVVVATALPVANKNSNKAADKSHRDGRLFPIYNNGLSVPNSRKFLPFAMPVPMPLPLPLPIGLPSIPNINLNSSMLSSILPPGATLIPPSSMTANAQNATPTAFIFTPLTGFTPLNKGNARDLAGNPCENNAECVSLYLQQLLESQLSPSPTAYSAYPDPTNTQFNGLQSYPQYYYDYSSSPFGYQSQYLQNSYPTLYSQGIPQQQEFFEHPGMFQQPIFLGQVPSDKVSSPQLVLYSSPTSFLQSLSENNSALFSTATEITLQDKGSSTQPPAQPATTMTHQIPKVVHQVKK